jgi:hypothetical protein
MSEENKATVHMREKKRKHAKIRSILVMLIDVNVPSSASEEV